MSDSMAFRYRAVAIDGRLERGEMVAADRVEVRAALADRGLFAVQLDPRETAAGRPVAVGQHALALRALTNLLDAGIPLARALSILEDMAPAVWIDALPTIRAEVRQGRMLAAAVGVALPAFPGSASGVLAAGEAAGSLAKAANDCALMLEESDRLRNGIRAALAYPAVLALSGFASLSLFVGVVLPRFAGILGELGQELPASTRLVLTTADVARSATVPLLLAGSAAFVAWRRWTSVGEGRRTWHRLLLEVPGLGPIRLAVASARVAAAAHALLLSGMHLLGTIPAAAQAAADLELARRFEAIRQKVLEGRPLSAAIEEERAMSVTAIRLIRSGEESGRLAEMFGHVARLEAERAERSVRSCVRLIEPILILLLGLLVAGVASAVLQAVYAVRPI